MLARRGGELSIEKRAERLARRIDETLQALQGLPHIFNLGHGIVPDTPPENVARLMERVRAHAGVPA